MPNVFKMLLKTWINFIFYDIVFQTGVSKAASLPMFISPYSWVSTSFCVELQGYLPSQSNAAPQSDPRAWTDRSPSMSPG